MTFTFSRNKEDVTMKRIITAALFVACTVTAGTAFAATTDGVQTLEKVVVTASRIEEKAKNVTQSVTVIAREEIAKNQYQDMGGLLRNHGLQVNTYSPNQSLSQLSMRGVRTSLMSPTGLAGEILLLVDGRRVGTDNISMIPLVNVERIEILRGPAAVQYGSSAIGGVVNVITRRGTENLSLMAEAGIGSWDTYKTQASAAWAKGPVDFSGGVSYLTSGDYRYGGGKKYPNTDLNYKLGYSLNLGLNFLDEHRISVTMLGVRADEMGSPNEYKNLQNDYTDRAVYSFDVAYEGGYKDAGLSWKTRYFNGKNNYLNDSWDDAGGFAYYKSRTEYQGAQGQVSFTRGFLTLTGGVDWNDYDTRAWADYYFPNEHSRHENIGYFALAKFAFFDDRLILNGGVRYDDYTMAFEGEERDLHKASPSAGVAFHATDWLTFRANYGESFRVPQANELLGFQGTLYPYVGNPDLKPEKGKTIDAGFEINHKSLNLGVTYFRTNYKQKIDYGFDMATMNSMYMNLDGTTKLRGIEAFASYDIGEAMDWSFMLRPYLNLTRMLKHRADDGSKVKYLSDLNVAYGLNFSHPQIGLDVDLRFTYLGKQDVQEFDPVTYATNEREIGGRTIIDLFVSQTLKEWDDAGKLSLKAEIRNMTDDRYATTVNYPMPGRSFYLGLRYDY